MKKNGLAVADLLNQQGEWLRSEGPESDVIISSRARLARNLARFPFLTVCDTKMRNDIAAYIGERLQHVKFEKDVHYFGLTDLGLIDRYILAERHLISRDHVNLDGERGVVVSRDETMSIMVNEEDHIRMQVMRSGYQLDEVWNEVNELDNRLGEHLHYAFDSRFGYVTCCPTNMGTGMRISVLMHLPAIVFSKKLEQVLQTLARVRYSIRGFFGEGTAPVGDFFQISNQVALGRTEEDIVQEMKMAIPEIIRFERGWREKLLREQSHALEDKIYRAYGVLKNAHSISSEETLELLSTIRLGINLKISSEIPIKVINELVVKTQPNHLQRICGRTLQQAERDVERARMIRDSLRQF